MGNAHWHVSAGTTICPECGGSPVVVQEPSRGEKLVHWLRFGMRLAPLLKCGNGHEWRAGSHTRMTLRAPHPFARLLRLPMALLRTLRQGRWMQPVPLTYVMAAGAGLVVGVAANLAFAWPWWIVAVGVVVAVWVFFASTAFWGQHRLTRHDLLTSLAPHRAHDIEMKRVIGIVDSGDQVVFGVADWAGDATLAGWGGRVGHRLSVTVRFDDGDERWVEVKTSNRVGREVPAGLLQENLAENLLGGLEQPPPGLEGDEWHDWLVARALRVRNQLPGLEWVSGSFDVDGREAPAEVLRLPEAAGVLIRLDEVSIEVSSRGVELDELRLAPIASLRPFLRDPD